MTLFIFFNYMLISLEIFYKHSKQNNHKIRNYNDIKLYDK